MCLSVSPSVSSPLSISSFSIIVALIISVVNSVSSFLFHVFILSFLPVSLLGWSMNYDSNLEVLVSDAHCCSDVRSSKLRGNATRVSASILRLTPHRHQCPGPPECGITKKPSQVLVRVGQNTLHLHNQRVSGAYCQK